MLIIQSVTPCGVFLDFKLFDIVMIFYNCFDLAARVPRKFKKFVDNSQAGVQECSIVMVCYVTMAPA